MTDYSDMANRLLGYAENAILAPARGMMAQPPQTNPEMGIMGRIHEAIDPVRAFGGYGGLLAMAAPPGAPRPYGNAPNSLMGFRKNGPQKAFGESNYRFTQKVRVTKESDDPRFSWVLEDEIEGLNKSHALERARRNWPGAKIEPID